MALVTPPETPLGSPCPDFALPDASGQVWSRAELSGPNGLVVAFICNHCPYVIRMAARLADDLRALRDEGVGAVCVMSNDWQSYPADAPDLMPAFALKHGLDVPYLVDADQSVARAFGAVCTPDLFGYGPDMTLGYRGRLDDGQDGSDRHPSLRSAMRLLAAGEQVPDQVPSMGCSIKWRA